MSTTTTSHLPDTLSEALAGVDFTEVTNGAQRLVFLGEDWVVKYDPFGQSNSNEVAWHRAYPDQVAPCKMLRNDLTGLADLPGLFEVMEAVEWVGWGDDGYSAGCNCPDCYLDDDDAYPFPDLCSDDLHDGNVGTLYNGNLVAIDMGCCHPESGDPGDFEMRSYGRRATVLHIAEAFGVTMEMADVHVRGQ